MDLNIFDFASLFQVALGMNLAVPFFPDAINRSLSRVRQTLESLFALQNFVPETTRGEYLGEVSKVRQEFKKCEDDTRLLSDRLSILLVFFAILSFMLLYYGSSNPKESTPSWAINCLLVACFAPPIGSVIWLYLYTQKRSTDVRIALTEVYNTYIERAAP